MAAAVSWDDAHIGHVVCDVKGAKIGVISAAIQITRGAGTEKERTEGYAQCDCRLPFLRKQLYIPFDAFGQCDKRCCYLDASRGEVRRKGWDREPGTR